MLFHQAKLTEQDLNFRLYELPRAKYVLEKIQEAE